MKLASPHADLSVDTPQAANILVGGDGRVVLGDMGTCAALELRNTQASAPRLRRASLDAAQAYLGQDKFKGTAQYHAPGVSMRRCSPHNNIQVAGQPMLHLHGSPSRQKAMFIRRYAY